jgi:predicted permease
MSLSEGWRRLRRVIRADAREEVADEIRFHLEMRGRDYELRGLDRESAERAARDRFGDVEGVRSALERMNEGERRMLNRRSWLDELRQDVRYGVRAIRRAPLIFLTVVLTLGLGIGATTAIFSVVHGVLLRPLPYESPERLVQIWEVTPRGEDHNVVSSGNYMEWRARSRSFEALGARYAMYGVAMTGEGEPEQVQLSAVTASVLEVLGISPLIGRLFTEEDIRSREPVVLLSHDFWQRRFGGDAGVVGRTVMLDGVSRRVVGVMPRGFEYPSPQAQLWRLIHDTELDPDERRSHNFLVIGKLAPGVSLEQARAEMREIAGALSTEWPQYMKGWGVNVTPLHEDMVAGVQPLLLVLLAGVIMVLLVACGNIANLLLARAMTRSREMAVRGALGASRQRLLRQAVTESLLLASLGGALGMALAGVLLRALLSIAPADIPLLDEVRLDPVVFLFAAGTTLASTLVFGLLPALRLSRSSLQATLRESDTRSGGLPSSRLRGALLIAEVALALMLMIGAGLLVRSAQRVANVEYGYDKDGLLAIDLNLPRARYTTSESQIEFYVGLTDQVRALPGVMAAAATSESPAAGSTTFSFAIEGRPSENASGREDPQALRTVTPDYFRTLHIPLIAGRFFDERDRAGATEVVIIDQALAHLHWPGENPVGRRISLAGAQGPWKEIVGVVGATRWAAADQEPAPAMYIPYAQKTWPWLSWQTLMVRPAAGLDNASVSNAIRSAVRRQDPGLPIHRIVAVPDLYGQTVAGRRFAMAMLVGFAAVALGLGMVGMYGVLAYTVAQQRREIGIRIALGATAAGVTGAVVAHALKLTAIGIAMGMTAALLLTRLITSLLYEVSPSDPLTLATVTLLVTVVATLAAWIPAQRAARVSPLTIMKA